LTKLTESSLSFAKYFWVPVKNVFWKLFLKHYKFTKRSVPSSCASWIIRPRVKSQLLDRGWSADPWTSRHQSKNSESAWFERGYAHERKWDAHRKVQAS
jgi:hypothetical protein